MTRIKLIDADVLQTELEEAVKLATDANDRMGALNSIPVLHMARRVADALTCLQERIAELERAPIKYDGPFETGKSYTKGTFVTYGGSLWHANTYIASATKPGDGPSWTLAVKRGTDGKEGR